MVLPTARGTSEAAVPPRSHETRHGIYQELAGDSTDAVGAIAYVLYKRDKIAFVKATYDAHRRSPTSDELKVFHIQTCQPSKIESYRTQAQQLSEAFLNAALTKQMQEFEDEIRESVLNRSVLAIVNELRVKKGVGPWLANIAANLGVNIATILVIGALLGGYQALAKFNANVERIAKVPVSAEEAGGNVPARQPEPSPNGERK